MPTSAKAANNDKDFNSNLAAAVEDIVEDESKLEIIMRASAYKIKHLYDEAQDNQKQKDMLLVSKFIARQLWPKDQIRSY